jgi:hypothetical protein
MTLLIPQVTTFMRKNFSAIRAITPIAALLEISATLLYWPWMCSDSKRANFTWVVASALIALVILNLPAILGGLGLTASCQ